MKYIFAIRRASFTAAFGDPRMLNLPRCRLIEMAFTISAGTSAQDSFWGWRTFCGSDTLDLQVIC